MNKLYVGLILEIVGAGGILVFPLSFLMTFRKRYIILSLMSLIILLSGFVITLL